MRVRTETAERLRKRGFNAWWCFNCGTCTALCPMELGILPRELFRRAILGEDLSELAETVFSCLLCGLCEAFCPQEVGITQNVRILRELLVENVWKMA
ncbi:MAG: CMP-binding protein [Thermodesulfatator sp.]|nr:MAG: CMP-binding protein [Thermodesulfatator sp.]